VPPIVVSWFVDDDDVAETRGITIPDANTKSGAGADATRPARA